MNKEELFCKLFPEYVVNGKPLSPYFDLFESGYEQAENRIEELEAELDAIDKAGEHVRQQINDAFRNKKPYWELEKENAELREELNYAKSHCLFHSDCPTQKENAELKAQLENERDLPAIAYMQGAEKQKKKDEDKLIRVKELIKNIVRVTWGEGWNYSLDWKVKAEQFLKENK